MCSLLFCLYIFTGPIPAFGARVRAGAGLALGFGAHPPAGLALVPWRFRLRVGLCSGGLVWVGLGVGGVAYSPVVALVPGSWKGACRAEGGRGWQQSEQAGV